METDWKLKGACSVARAPLEYFYPPRARGRGSRFRNQLNSARALGYCRECPVMARCLEEALRRSPDADYGIWGGTTEAERRQLRKGRNRQAERIA